MRIRTSILLIVLLAAINVPLRKVVVRWDMTGDKRYTLHPAAKQETASLDGALDITVFLDGKLNSGFRRLRDATYDTALEMQRCHKPITVHGIKEEEQEKEWQKLFDDGFEPVLVHEKQQNGKSEQSYIWPYARLKYKGRSIVVELLQRQRGLTAEENLNVSVENIEYALAEAIHTLKKDSVEKIAFLEGHGELAEANVYDWSKALSKYYQIDRGVLGTDANMLSGYKALVIADPQQPFSETDKYLIDSYIMRGGKVMWLLNGVRFSDDMLTQDGITPVIALDLKLTDMLFRYGVRINPALVQDLQCLRVPADISGDPQRPQYQPIPWTYAPLLLTSEASPITHNLMQVSATFASCIDFVGGDDGLKKNVILATSTASALTPTPAEVDLSDLSVVPERFNRSYLPVAASLEGCFPSLYAHRQRPMSITGETTAAEKSVETRQVVVAAGSVARNEWQQGQPLPVGYDRYTKTQFSNRDFLVNAMLWLTDENNLISLRHKSVALRLINDKKAHEQQLAIQLTCLLLPLLLLALTGIAVHITRRIKYTR